jgi:hypothetical protein
VQAVAVAVARMLQELLEVVGRAVAVQAIKRLLVRVLLEL